jgi:hypothetical protein
MMRVLKFPTKPTGDFCGSRQWAESHAARLQSLVGMVEAGRLTTAVCAAPYGQSKRRWCVTTRWRYAEQKELGEFGGSPLYLPH